MSRAASAPPAMAQVAERQRSIRQPPPPEQRASIAANSTMARAVSHVTSPDSSVTNSASPQFHNETANA